MRKTRAAIQHMNPEKFHVICATMETSNLAKAYISHNKMARTVCDDDNNYLINQVYKLVIK